MSQSCVPATPPFGQVTTQLAPAGQTVWQGPLAQWNRQTLPWPQVHVPSAQVPSHRGLDPWQVTWHGGAPHANEQLAPEAHVHSPLAHVAAHDEPGPQSTWHGGLMQEKLQEAFGGQAHVPFEQSSFGWLQAAQSARLAASMAAAAAIEWRTATAQRNTERLYAFSISSIL
jgi:hypothetical protein